MSGGLLGAGGAITEIPEISEGLGATALIGKADKHTCCYPAEDCGGSGAGGGHRLDQVTSATQVGGSQADIKNNFRSWYKNCNI